MNALKQYLDKLGYKNTATAKLERLAEPDEALVEAVARAIFEVVIDDPWEMATETDVSILRIAAKTALETLAQELVKP